ncbi:hypothetical protein AVEN_228150-1 [Araneus ventricosus]|uniref:Reverse transcriptase domain-containing protein n=1 Tax=Araneus ventricosus TaxID=182803 RepID=A0A4Y2CV04_ARAVE|nr:hypothetical protein AVEN_228150-1 [Araneus ventricosus]
MKSRDGTVARNAGQAANILGLHYQNINLLPKAQYGFREGHSTTDQVIYFCQSIIDAQNKRPTNHTVAVFLDLTKTFDRVWNQKLITKLYEVFGISGRALMWIYAFLRNSLIRVNFNNSLSRNFKLSQGVPQGSVLSLILSSLFLSGIEQVTNGRRERDSFADDIVLWRTGTDLKKLESDVNQAFVDLWNFAEDHKLSFNPSKSTVGFFIGQLYNFHPNTLLNHQILAVNKHPKCLGFVLDGEILSNKHIDHLVMRARRQLNILKYISGRDWGADASTIRYSYISLIRPILEYGYPIYCCASDTNLKGFSLVLLVLLVFGTLAPKTFYFTKQICNL